MLGEAVFDRIEVDVVHVGGVVGFVADGVFPEAVLPDAAVTVAQAGGGAGFGVGKGFGEGDLDGAPTAGEVGVVFRQGPEAVYMVGQDHPGVDVEGATVQRRANGGAKSINVNDKQVGAAVEQIDGEEIGSARDTVATIIGHVWSVPSVTAKRKGGSSEKRRAEERSVIRHRDLVPTKARTHVVANDNMSERQRAMSAVVVAVTTVRAESCDGGMRFAFPPYGLLAHTDGSVNR